MMKKTLLLLLMLFSKSVFAQQPYVGEIRLFAGNFAPNGWFFCDGRLLAISEYDTLFNLIGTTYGGDGQSTFALPDLRGRVPVHKGSGPGLTTRVIGEAFGQESVQLTTQNLPAHTHNGQLMVSNLRATSATPTAMSSIATSGISSGRTFRPNVSYTTASPTITLQTVTTAPTGTSVPVSVMKPFVAINYIISMFGIYPTQQ